MAFHLHSTQHFGFSLVGKTLLWALTGILTLPNAFAQTPSATNTSTTLPSVIVTGKPGAPGQETASINGISDATVATTPLSITVIRAENLRQAGAGNLSNVLRADSSSTDFYNTTGFIESAQIRGFLLDNSLNFRRDGLPTSNYAPLVLENKERIEILKGLSGVQAGTSTPGGLINYTLKRPTNTALREVFAGISERGTTLLSTDLGGRFGAAAFGYRINAAIENRRPMADHAPGKRSFLSGAFDARLPADSLLEAEFELSKTKQISVPGFGLLDTNGDGVAETLPPPIDPRVNLNNQPWSLPFESRSTIMSLGFKQPLSNTWRYSLRVSSQKIRTQDRLAFPDGCSNGPEYVYPGFCANGDADVYDYRSENERRSLRALEAKLQGNVSTAAIKHEIGLTFTQSRYAERFEPSQAYNYVGYTNIYAPLVLPADPTPKDKNTLRDSQTKEVAVTDVMRFGEHWSLWLGARHTQLSRSSVRTDGSRAVAYTQRFTTPWVALGYVPWQGGYLYLSAGSGIESDVVPNRPDQFANYGEVLPALRSHQQEIGFKQVLANAGLFTATLFNISKPFFADTSAGSPENMRVAGGREARHRGLELSWRGNVLPSLNLQAQATFLNARISNSLDPNEIGRRARNVPPYNASLMAAWTVPGVEGWVWTNRLAFTGEKAVNLDNSVQLPATAQLDSYINWRQQLEAMSLTWRAGIDNVFNRRYWKDAPTQYWGGSYLFPAQPRTFRVSAQMRF